MSARCAFGELLRRPPYRSWRRWRRSSFYVLVSWRSSRRGGVVVAYVVITYVGVAWVVAGGPVRRIGAAIIAGEAFGGLVFAACVYVAVHDAGGSS